MYLFTCQVVLLTLLSKDRVKGPKILLPVMGEEEGFSSIHLYVSSVDIVHREGNCSQV